MIDEYKEATDFLFTQLPMFQNIGAGAYKPGLDSTIRLAEHFGNPHRHYPTIHIAGTNGKGSTAHTIAAVLQRAGYRTGLFTSPHLLDFRERIRVDGEMIPEEAVVDFVRRYRQSPLAATNGVSPTFFELTTVMAFEYFAESKVDVAVIEVGLGGRLDSTNIITPALSIITNISLDHTALLGDTPEAIATEKAGIIKKGVPVVIGEADGAVRSVFALKAEQAGAAITYASEERYLISKAEPVDGKWLYVGTPFGTFTGELGGECQPKNTATILAALMQLRSAGWEIGAGAVADGFANVCELTGLMGRWMKVADNPVTVCDTGHNPGGWQYLGDQLGRISPRLVMVVGFVNDKDISSILGLMPREARYVFTRASVERALPAEELRLQARKYGLDGPVTSSVAEAYKKALDIAAEGDTVFVGGSTFVVADLLAAISGQR